MKFTLVVACAGLALAAEPECKKFSEIYGKGVHGPNNGGKNVCEKMWGSAFTYETDLNRAYDPRMRNSHLVTEHIHNNNIGRKLYDYNTETRLPNNCLTAVAGLHFDVPTEDPGLGISACSAYKGESCCKSENFKTNDIVKNLYAGYEWDRCGKLSENCQRFFVWEACLYECDPAAAFFQTFLDHDSAKEHPDWFNRSDAYLKEVEAAAVASGDNTTLDALKARRAFDWQISKMPLSSSFCDDWYTACQDDLFCAEDSGDYFSCAAKYKEHDLQKNQTAMPASSSDDLEDEYIVLFIVLALVAALALFCIFFMIYKEKAGKPIYYTPAPGGAQSGAAEHEPTETEMRDEP